MVAPGQLAGRGLKQGHDVYADRRGWVALDPGTVLAASLHEGLLVACGIGEAVALLNIQTEGKKPLTAPEFLRGRALAPGTVLA